MGGILHTCTHIYVYICVVENGSLKDKDTLNSDCHRNASLRLVALLLTRRFFCKCNAKNSDSHNASLHTVEECKGGRGSLLCNRVLVIAVFVEDAFEWSISHQPRVMNIRTKARERFHFCHEPPLLGPGGAFYFGIYQLDLSQIQGSRVNLVQGFNQSDWLRSLSRM